MRYHEIIEGKPATAGVAPLTPAQSRQRAKRVRKAQTKVNDVVAANNTKLQVARRRLTEI